MRIGILELLSDSARQNWKERLFDGWFARQYASITPQSVAVWCRQLGHEVHYATYYGQRDPKRLLPDSLDVVFVSTYTHASALAYGLARLYRKEGSLTVIGGPHARSYPTDCLRGSRSTIIPFVTFASSSRAAVSAKPTSNMVGNKISRSPSQVWCSDDSAP